MSERQQARHMSRQRSYCLRDEQVPTRAHETFERFYTIVPSGHCIKAVNKTPSLCDTRLLGCATWMNAQDSIDLFGAW